MARARVAEGECMGRTRTNPVAAAKPVLFFLPRAYFWVFFQARYGVIQAAALFENGEYSIRIHTVHQNIDIACPLIYNP